MKVAELSDWLKTVRLPCMEVVNPFNRETEDDDEEPITVYEAMYYKRIDCGDDDPPPDYLYGPPTEPVPIEEGDYVGFPEFPSHLVGVRPIYTMICDICGRLFFGVRSRYDCPFCGDARGGWHKRSNRVLWESWDSRHRCEEETEKS